MFKLTRLTPRVKLKDFIEKRGARWRHVIF